VKRAVAGGRYKLLERYDHAGTAGQRCIPATQPCAGQDRNALDVGEGCHYSRS